MSLIDEMQYAEQSGVPLIQHLWRQIEVLRESEARLALAMDVVEAARSVSNDWNEFGDDVYNSQDLLQDRLWRALKALDAQQAERP